MRFSRHLANTLELAADVVPEQTAIIHGDRELPWRDFDDRAARLATALAESGVGRGEVVAIAMYNCPEWLEAFFGILKHRAVPANVNYRYRSEEMFYLLNDCSAAALIFHASLADVVLPLRDRLPSVRLWIMVDDSARILHEPVLAYEELLAGHAPAKSQERPGDEHYLSYTGGTTGLPKGVLFRLGLTTAVAHRFVNAIFEYQYSDETDPVEMTTALHDAGQRLIALTAAPLMHSTGLAITAIPTLAVGGTVVLLTNRSFDPHLTLAEIERTAANRLTIVGDVFARPLLEALSKGRPGGDCYRCESLRIIVSSGAALTASTKQRLLEQLPGVSILESLGATEGVSFGVSVSKAGDPLDTGRFMAAKGVIVVDEDFNPLPEQTGHTGLLAAPTITSGYLNNPGKSVEIYRQIDGVLYAAPGDYGRLEADGSLTLLGRGSGVINTGGEKVFAEEVEDVLKQLGGVLDCIVTGLPDEHYGQRVAALVQLAADAVLTETDLVSHAKRQLAGYKAPRRVVFADAMPRGPNGKPDYDRVRELLTRTQ